MNLIRIFGGAFVIASRTDLTINRTRTPTSLYQNMPHTSSPPILNSFASSADLVDALAEFILKTQKVALEKKGRFTIALSGGSLPKQLGGLIGKPGIRWDKWCGYRADAKVLAGC